MIGLRLQHSRLSYGDRVVIDNLNLEIRPGEFVSLLGPSGCGKSTVLRAMAGLMPLSSGKIERTVGPLSVVFQDARLLPWKTVRENIELPFHLKGESPPELAEILQQMGLQGTAELFPHQLSGGMKQRVAIARALIGRPQLLLMDEPFSALDEGTRQDLEALLRKLWQRLGMTLVFVTHSLAEAVFLSERVLVLGSQGRLLRDEAIHLAERDQEVRTTVPFNAQVRELSTWLRDARRSGT